MSDLPELIPVSQPTLPDYERLAVHWRRVVESGMITNDVYVRKLEAAMKDLTGAKHVVATSSNTSGMTLSWQSFGFPAGAEVLLPSFTFPASSHAIRWNNLTPVFVDIDFESCLLDLDKLEAALTPKTVGILAVALWGNPCDYERLEAFACKHGLKLMFDSAQGLGCTYRNKAIGRGGDVEIFSLSPTKLATAAEGGLVVTDDDHLADYLRAARNYGLDSKGCEMVGLNARMSEFHAVIACEAFVDMQQHIDRRATLVAAYRKGLASVEGIGFPQQTPETGSNYVYFAIIIDEAAFGLSRDALMDKLEAANIQSRRYGCPPLHQLACNRDVVGDGLDLPDTMRAAETALVLPLFSHMTDNQLERVLEVVRS